MNSIEVTLSEFIDAGFFTAVAAILAVLLVYYVIYRADQRVRTAIADDAFVLDNYFTYGPPKNFLIVVRVCKKRSLFRFFSWFIRVEVHVDSKYVYNDDSPAFLTPGQVTRYRNDMLRKSPAELCAAAHDRYMIDIIDNFDGGKNGQS